MNKKTITAALCGNPNVGKTTIFNALTGSRQKTGNWPGVTIEKKTGTLHYKGYDFELTDLPGTYSLSAYSPDAEIARNYILLDRPDVVIQIIDSTNPERNLYLTSQLLTLTQKAVIDLNITDSMARGGRIIDDEKLSAILSLPVVKTVGTKKTGIEKLLDAVIDVYEGRTQKGDENPFTFDEETERRVSALETKIQNGNAVSEKYPPRWLAESVFENDSFAKNLLGPSYDAEIEKAADGWSPEEREAMIADSRYSAIAGILEKVETVTDSARTRIDPSALLDRVMTDKWLGIPIFLALMCGAFDMTFSVSAPFGTMIEYFFAFLGGLVTQYVPGFIGSLLGDCVIGGAGSVIVFVPTIMLLFFVLSLLEDTGYMARAAFVIDRPMYMLGLTGKAFIPMMSAFGCNVPGMMAARTIENEKDRFATILVTPFMSCGAKLFVYALLAGIFFPACAGQVIFSIYVLGIGAAILSAYLLKKTILKGEPAPFIMEIPPYRLPTAFSAIEHMLSRGYIYVRKAGTFILAGAIIVWLLASLPVGVEYGTQESYIGAVGTAIQPVFEPLGFDWKLSVSLIFGFAAKEMIVGSLGTLYGTGDSDMMLQSLMAADPAMNPLNALTYMVFVLLYLPCAASLATIKKETGSWKWTGFAAVYTCVFAWAAAFAVRLIAANFM